MNLTLTWGQPKSTGAGSGINLSFAALLLSRNCNVVLADLGLRPEAERLVAQYDKIDNNSESTVTDGDKTGRPRAVFVKTDVTSWPALAHMFDVALREFGGVDVLCPGAGVYEPHWSSFWHPPGQAPEARDNGDGAPGHYALLDINLTHPIRATQLALTHWLHPSSSSSGKAVPAAVSPENPKRIVHIGSVAGQMPNLNAPLYGASVSFFPPRSTQVTDSSYLLR